MAWDIAIHPTTGDWLFTAKTDLVQVSGPEQMAQRIHIRLRCQQGAWLYDTTRTFGSRLRQALRLPRQRMVDEIPMMVSDALAPMGDLVIDKVEVEHPEANERFVRVTVRFHPKTDPLVPEDVRAVALGGIAVIDIPLV